jgi:TPR repeat protein
VKLVLAVLVAACGGGHGTAPGPRPIAKSSSKATYERGNELEQSGEISEAFALYHASCEADARSCVAASNLIREGKMQSVARDQAHMYMVLACGENYRDPLACAVAGVELVEGNASSGDRERDKRMGVGLLGKACDAGIALGCYAFGVAVRDGTGGFPKNERLAYLSFERACLNRPPPPCPACALGCREQGRALEAGRGVTKDAVRGAALKKQACAAHSDAC